MAICTIVEIEDVLSEHGVRLATDDQNMNAFADTTMVSNAIERATQKIYQYASLRYQDALFEGNDWCKWCCAVFAAVQLMRRRGGGVPPGLMDEYNEYIEWLEKVQAQTAEIPGLQQENEPGVTTSNLIIDQRFPSAKPRVVRGTSAGEISSKKPRFTDHFEGFNR